MSGPGMLNGRVGGRTAKASKSPGGVACRGQPFSSPLEVESERDGRRSVNQTELGVSWEMAGIAHTRPV
jgi:hypothetical protein